VTLAGAEPVAMKMVSGDAGIVSASVRSGRLAVGTVPFELTLHNASHDSITITNPYEGASYHLINVAGSPVQVQAPTIQAKVHIALDPTAKLAYLDLAAATVNGKAVTSDDFVRSASFELAAGGEAVLSLVVRAALDPSDRTTLDHVPAGDYQIAVTLRVVVSVDGKRHPLLLRTTNDLAVTAA
jgi:hypothetical protein